MDMYQRTFAALSEAGWPQDDTVVAQVFAQLRRRVHAELARWPAEERDKGHEALEKAIRRLDVERFRL